ncbi:glutathione peroxidase [Brachybacterium huguangmaarense]
MTALFDFSVRDLHGGMQDLAQYRDRVTLVVNTASRCFFASQFDSLEKLQRDYEDRGFTVLAFPCDQFGHQEPLDDAEIEEFCRHEAGVTFPVFSKIEVNGPGADPLYRWLTTQGGGLVGGRIAWNFTKFLVGRDGQVVRRYAPPIPPARIARRIEQTLPALAA